MNVLAVGAHADDIELGCGGTLAKFKDRGDSIIIYTATASGGRNPFGGEIRNKNESLKNGKRAAQLLNAKLIVGSFETNEVEYTDTLNSELIRVIYDNKIDVIFAHWINDAHHDHRNLARATIHAGRHINNILMYKSNWYQPSCDFKEDFFVDISDFWEIKKELLLCYSDEMKRTEGKWIKYFQNCAENNGMKIGTKYAESFCCFKWMI